MSASPSATTAQSQKRPLEEPSSPNGTPDQPDAKRPALDKVVKEEEKTENDSTAPAQDAAADAPEATASNGAKDEQGDTVVPDAPANAAAIPGTQPIQSTTDSNGRATSQGPGAHQDESNWLHIRAIISSPEAATVIGKGGENVTQIRKMAGAKCTVSDYSRGATERILTVSGVVDAVAKVSAVRSCFPSTSTNKL